MTHNEARKRHEWEVGMKMDPWQSRRQLAGETMTTTTKAVTHMPGPWAAARKVEEHDDSTLDRPYFSIDTDTANQTGDRHSAYIARVDGLRGERQEANARLIAAAPEMLEALEACLRAIVSEWGECEGCKVDPCTQCRTRAAIQKAKGGQ